MPTKGADAKIPNVSFHQYLWQKCLDYGDQTSLVDNSCDGKSLTFKEIYDQSRTCAAFLHESGLKVGDFVGICAPTCLEFAVAMIGIIGSGATATPCNPAYHEGEILQQFRISEPKAVFVHESAIKTMKNVKLNLPCLETIFVIGKSDEYITMDVILESKNNFGRLSSIEINPFEDIAMLPYSSGTTGLPKSVMLTHRNIVALAVVFGQALFPRTTTTAHWNSTCDACLYMDRPMYHAGGYNCVFLSIASGVKLVMEKEFHIETMLKTIGKYRVTHLLTVPPILIELVNAKETVKYDTSSLQNIAGGGASMAPDVLQRLTKKFGITMSPCYGMTEVGLVSMSNNPNDSLASAGSVSSTVELKIINLETAEECAVDQNGEIIVRGPQVMKGYIKNPKATSSTIDKEGWLHTGDIGRLGEDGLLYIVDRLKEVIKYKSLQVPPAELESVILKHPKVADVGVIGIPDQEAGELPKAFVVKKDGSLTGKEVKEFVKSQLVDYKHLRGGVEFVKAIPKSPTGKIQRKELKKMAGLEV